MLTLFAKGEAVRIPAPDGKSTLVAVTLTTIEIGDSHGYVMAFPTTKAIGNRACAIRHSVPIGDITSIEDLDDIKPANVANKVRQVIAAIDENRPVGHVYYVVEDENAA